MPMPVSVCVCVRLCVIKESCINREEPCRCCYLSGNIISKEGLVTNPEMVSLFGPVPSKTYTFMLLSMLCFCFCLIVFYWFLSPLPPMVPMVPSLSLSLSSLFTIDSATIYAAFYLIYSHTNVSLNKNNGISGYTEKSIYDQWFLLFSIHAERKNIHLHI